MGKMFGIPTTEVKRICDEVIHSVEHWTKWAEQAQVSDKDIMRISQVIRC